MATQPRRKHISVEEYFELERTHPDQSYEYIDGEIYLMSGGSPAHALIIANLIGEIRAQLRGGPCKTFSSDAKVKVSETRYVCPDVTVSCVEQDRQAGTKMLEHPCFVIEVLSPSTETLDRHKKSEIYRTMPSIGEYALVESEIQAVEVYKRLQNGFWAFTHFGPGSQVQFSSLGVTLAIEAIYEDVIFPPEETEVENQTGGLL
jgi:Uma2 family endonuclease